MNAGRAGVPHTPRIKICGHTNVADVRASVAAGADAIGVIAAVPVDSPREVTVETATALVEHVPPLVTSVLVTMPATLDDALDLVETVRPDALQIHGAFSVHDLRAVVDELTIPVLRAIDADDADLARACDPVADVLLVDTPAVDGGGGTGRTHAWDRTRELVQHLDSPVLLAGGLTPANVADAVATVAPFGVDVASGVERLRSDRDARPEAKRGDGVESAGGVKDHEAVRRFISNAREANEVVV